MSPELSSLIEHIVNDIYPSSRLPKYVNHELFYAEKEQEVYNLLKSTAIDFLEEDHEKSFEVILPAGLFSSVMTPFYSKYTYRYGTASIEDRLYIELEDDECFYTTTVKVLRELIDS